MICGCLAKLYFGAVARRIEIELTSARPDGTWTWRAAGALNPRGTLDGSLLYGGAKAGDVVRAEAEFGMEGIAVTSVEPPRPPESEDPNQIKLLERPAVATVTTQLAGRGRPERLGAERDGRRAPSGERPARGALNGSAGPRGEASARSLRRPVPEGARPLGDRQRPERGDRPDRGRRPGGPPVTGAPGTGAPTTGVARMPQVPGPDDAGTVDAAQHTQATPGGARRQRQGQTEGATGRFGAQPAGARAPGRSVPRRHEGADGPPPSGHRPHRLSPGSTHRNAMLESLPAEQRPIAQQLLRGGIPAVRTALHFERERAREEGRPEPSTEGVLAIAESLVSRVKAAEWRDRAEAAIKAGDELAMRDLRSLVSGSDTARDEASRGLVVALRELLDQRVEAHRKRWEEEVAKHLEEVHVLRALRLSARPPDPGARFSAELAGRLRDAASAALSPSAPADKWLALLEAVVESPVRRTVKPEGLPAKITPELLQAARQQCGRVPALAPLLGLSVPPPPGPSRPIASASLGGRTTGVAAGRQLRQQGRLHGQRPPRPTPPAKELTRAKPRLSEPQVVEVQAEHVPENGLPTHEAPTHELPADEGHVDGSPADEGHADESPADESYADEGQPDEAAEAGAEEAAPVVDKPAEPGALGALGHSSGESADEAAISVPDLDKLEASEAVDKAETGDKEI